MADVDIILCDIIAEELSLSASRVVVYDENFEPPKDEFIFVIVSLAFTKIIGTSNKFAPAETGPPIKNDREIKSIALSETYNVEITSKNRDAQTRRYEINMALPSDYSEQKQELNHIKIFRTNQNIDLSFIEGSSSLHRYRIPVIIDSVKTIEKDIVPFEHFQTPAEVFE